MHVCNSYYGSLFAESLSTENGIFFLQSLTNFIVDLMAAGGLFQNFEEVNIEYELMT